MYKSNYIDQFIRQRENHIASELRKSVGKRNIYPEATDAQLVVDCLTELLLGDDWYVSDPLPNCQVNTIALDEILYKRCRKYRNHWKKKKKEET